MGWTIAGQSCASGRGGRKVRTPHLRKQRRAMRLVTPGGQPRRLCRKAEFHARRVVPGSTRFGAARSRTVPQRLYRQGCATGDSLQENLRDIFLRFTSPVRVKRWGKSPPLSQQCGRHGKPRVVQDQIGGESWPGSLSCAQLCRGLVGVLYARESL